MQITLGRDGKQFGPYTLEQVNSMLASGRVQPDDLAWTEGMPQWVALREVPGVLALPPVRPAHAASVDDGSSDKLVLPAFLLAFFIGVFGVHRFYVGKTGSGIAMVVLTLTVVGALVTAIWALVDWIVILCGGFTDAKGRRLTRWT
jgi:TM2 domain-containing membrane protein YozV